MHDRDAGPKIPENAGSGSFLGGRFSNSLDKTEIA
jgi:hypothetical protein